MLDFNGKGVLMKRKLLSLTLALTTLLASNIGTLTLGNVSASSETLETETTTTTEEMVEAEPVCYMKVVSNPDKTVYNIGDEIDLSGLKIDVLYAPGGEMPISQLNKFKTVIDSANPLEDDHFIVETSEFDSSQVGSYNIKISLTKEASSCWWYCQSIYIPVTVMDKNTEITGDANGDNTFDIADVIALNKWILNMPNITISNTNAVDLNSDGKVNIIDLCLMKNMLISQNNTPVLYASGWNYDGSSYNSFEYVITADGNKYNLEIFGDTNCACDTREKHIINHIMSSSTKKQFITTSEDLKKIVEFSKNATKYKDSELKKLDLTLADLGTFHLWMLYKDENDELQEKRIYAYGYDNAYLDNDEVKDFLKFLIENEYIDGNLNFFE